MTQVQAKYADDLLSLWGDNKLQGGEFKFYSSNGKRAGMNICCPGCKSICSLAFSGSPGNGPKWEWDGNEKEPSVHPSINHAGCWHGWLKNGVFTPC